MVEGTAGAPVTPHPADHGGVLSEVPLTPLLSWAWIAFTIETDNAAEAAGSRRVGRLFRISLPMWANGLRFIDAEGITVGELRARPGPRATSAGWSGGAGSLSVTPGAGGARATAVTAG